MEKYITTDPLPIMFEMEVLWGICDELLSKI